MTAVSTYSTLNVNEISPPVGKLAVLLKPQLNSDLLVGVMRFVRDLIIFTLLLSSVWSFGAPSAFAEKRHIGQQVCALTLAEGLSPDEALYYSGSFDCSDRALSAQSTHVWLLIDVRDLQGRYSDPALRLRMSYHEDISLSLVSNGKIVSEKHYPADELRNFTLIPDALVLPFDQTLDQGVDQILVGIEEVWDMTNWRDIAIVSESVEKRHHLRNAVIYSLLTGLLITPLILTALVYFALRMAFLPYHFGMILFGLIYGFSWSGLIFVLPFEITPIIRSTINHTSIPIAFFFACLLTRELCGRENISKAWSTRLFLGGITPVITSFILIAVAPEFSHYGSIIYHVGFLLPLMAITGTLIIGSKNGLRICQIQLIAWSPMIAYVSLRILRGTDIIQPSLITQYGLYPSLLIEALLTSSVICWRIFQIRKERDSALMRQSVLSDLANADALTGALNRRAFIEGFNHVVAAGPMRNRVISLLTLDLDHFKGVNDAHGHAVGDEVLKGITHILKSQCRGEDLCARFGGEEFSILLITSSSAAADACANRLRSAIEEHSFPIAGKVTASVGLVRVDPEAPVPFESWYNAADKALYVAKSKGRNRVQRSGWSPDYASQADQAYAAGWQIKKA